MEFGDNRRLQGQYLAYFMWSSAPRQKRKLSAELFPKLLGSKAGGVRAIVETPPELDASIFEVEVLPLS
jgi:hypothetical protein